MRNRASCRRYFRATALWSLAGIALMQLAIGSAIDVSLLEVRDPEYAQRDELLKECIQEHTERPLVVVLGSSRVQNGFDAESAAAALDHKAVMFNFGIPTSGPYLERIWLKRLLANGQKPAVLLIELIPVHYNAHVSPPDMRGLDGARLSVSEIAEMPLTFSSLAGPCRRWLIGRVVPAHRHQAELREHLGIDTSGCKIVSHTDAHLIDHFGWQARTFPPEQGAILKRLAHQQYDPCYRDFELSVTQLGLLEECLQLCRAEDVQAALLLAPEGSEFRSLNTPRMNLVVEKMLDDLKARFNVPVIDARTWMPDDAFFDMHHLKPEGATAFSRRLAQEKIAPLLSVAQMR